MDMKVIHTCDPKMRSLLRVVDNIASSRAAIMILGESGTGKELLARYIHNKSSRASKPFVALNCAAVPENLLESELFGYEKGAFTGAEQRKAGKFELANGGTFLLDEIGELPILLQAKLLRVIQEGEVERLGGTAPIKVNVRIIAATNRNIAEMVESGHFRSDLFYRLNVIPVEIPPLRMRKRDVELLGKLFLEISCVNNGLGLKVLSEEAVQKLSNWHWPGNVRELQNVIERSVLFSPETKLKKDDILIKGYDEKMNNKELIAGMTISEAEKLLIINTLEYTDQNRTRAAELLGISIRTLRNKINEYKQSGVQL